MSRLHLKSIALTLAVVVLLLLGATTGSAFAHEVQHTAHHMAGMHATPICAWTCATAGAVITPAVRPVQFTPVHYAASPFLSRLRSSEYLSRLQARAPPVLS